MSTLNSLTLTSYNAEFILYKSWGPEGLFQFAIIINVLLALSDSLEYQSYGSTTIINMFTLTMRGLTLYVRI